LSNDFLKEFHLTNVTYCQVTGMTQWSGDYCYCSRWCNVNFGFKQFMTAVGIFAAINALCPWTTFH